MPALPISGVYAITNHITGRAYVGSGKDVLNRKASHFWALRNRRHKNYLMQADFDLHGADAFEFNLVCTADEADRRRIEQSFIDSGSYSYNIAPKASGGGAPVTPIIRKRMSQAHTGKKHRPETIEKIRNRPAERSGSFIGYFITPAGSFPSTHEAVDAMGGVLNFTTIRRWCRDPGKVISEQSYRKSGYLQSMGEGVIGRTYRDLGFGFAPAKG